MNHFVASAVVFVDSPVDSPVVAVVREDPGPAQDGGNEASVGFGVVTCLLLLERGYKQHFKDPTPTRYTSFTTVYNVPGCFSYPTLSSCFKTEMTEKRCWLSQSPLRQFKLLPEVIVRKLERKEIAWDRYEMVLHCTP